MQSTHKGILLALAGCLIYSLHDAVIKHLGADLPTVQIAFFSGLLGLPLVIAMLIADPTPGTLRPNHPKWMALRSVAMIMAVFGAFYAFGALPLAQAYTILFAAPLLISVLAVQFLGERLGWRRGLAIVVGLLGVLIVLRPGVEPIGLGHAAALLSAIGNALVHITARRIGAEERLPVMVLYPILAVILGLGLALPMNFAPMTAPQFGALSVVAILSFLAMLCLIQAFKLAQAALVAPMQYSQLIWGVLLGALIFDEWPAGNTFLGAVLIIGSGVYIVLREAKLSEKSPAKP